MAESSAMTAPLRRSVFRALWIAAVASNVGTWMQEVGAAWLMTSLSPSPLLVTLIQAGSSLPMFLLAIPSGALADLVDRRRMLLATQTWMLCAAATLGFLTLHGSVTPTALLLVTFAMGFGVALNGPAWQAVISELVPRSELPAAVALNSVGFNLARAVGPALGGLVIAAAGPGVTFLLNAASFLGTVFVLYGWDRPATSTPLAAERLAGAMRGGLRYVRYQPELRAVMMRAGGFMFFSIALMALLPLLARGTLGLGPTGYGVMLGSLGFGAVTGAAVLGRLRQGIGAERLVQIGCLVFAACCIGIAHIPNFPAVCALMWIAGNCWLMLLSSFHVAAQGSVAGWVLARALSIYLLAFSGSMALGSATWGALAVRVGPPWSLTVAAVGLVVTLPILTRFRLPALDGRDLSPTKFSPAPRFDLSHDRGPVMVTVRYDIADADRAAFTGLMRQMELVRRRSGAVGWALYEDPEQPQLMLEVFMVDSWIEHLRQHERGTRTDAVLRDRIRALHRGDESPSVTHLLAVD
ncbi:MAG: MFS transporter [Candidatus Binatia bacterium]